MPRITTYKPKATQEQRILEFLRLRGDRGVEAWEIPAYLHILQYNSRIFGLREKGYVIDNVKGTFYLIHDILPVQFDNNGQGKLI